MSASLYPLGLHLNPAYSPRLKNSLTRFFWAPRPLRPSGSRRFAPRACPAAPRWGSLGHPVTIPGARKIESLKSGTRETALNSVS